ncbi:dihydropteroate synthase [Alterisphingorhabdus coralli]|uniref:dihydropteroate synthase n=1 Tax=Alterisphingorhabdus coralli TaxID=3071408 RepID=A0AA97HZ50_9SPHN|nr:dihydropteroate synthase [Parasphingorhabdus sp. SCSIO 66989]WOE74209.1 dihydropteroate synthase [Parasphingorhabdus sp. SCSIO 66989]
MRAYLHPVALAQSPQAVEGSAIRLGGSMVWANMLRLDCWDGDTLAYRAVIVADTFNNDTLADVPKAAREQVQRQYANLQEAHAPIALQQRTLRFDQPQIMGILNVTPDSFSDGGEHDTPHQAVDAGFAMTSHGAAMVDIGGESTRPNAQTVWEGDEIARIEPVVQQLVASGTIISIDTRNAAVMEAALAAGAALVNDISALLYDHRSIEVILKADCPVVLMHAPSQGDDPHENDKGYSDVVRDVFDWLAERIDAVAAAGVKREKIIIDPGLGFGKSLGDNLALLNALPLFHALGQPLLVGASRKRMIGALSNEEPTDQRLPGSLALALHAMNSGTHILRVHDVPETLQAMRVWRGLRDSALTSF